MYIASKSRSGGVTNRRKSSSGGVLGGLGASWGAVARFWYVFCETLGRTWAHHGPSWSQVDNKLRPRRAMISARPGKPLIPPRLLHPMGTYLGSVTLYNIVSLFKARNNPAVEANLLWCFITTSLRNNIDLIVFGLICAP